MMVDRKYLIDDDLIGHGDTNSQRCPVCGSLLTYKGLGDYFCEKCEQEYYDEYAFVRRYIEEHPGATIPEVSNATGISRQKIMLQVKQGNFDVIGHNIDLLGKAVNYS